MKKITISEETKIPGTDYVLEAGDRIEVLKEAQINNVSDAVKEYIRVHEDDNDSFMAGWRLAQEVRTSLNSSIESMKPEKADLFLDGFLQYLRK